MSKSTENFPEMDWADAVEKVSEVTYRIYTDHSMGTGFLFMVGKGTESFYAALVTAWHVVKDTETGTSIKICDKNGNEIVRSHNDNISVIEIGETTDSAIIIIKSSTEIFKKDYLLPILPVESQLKTGVEIGWMGYPGIVEPELCFFHGYISGTLKKPAVYLVDGVAINGVSGGPVFDNRCHVIGFVSAYLPNKVNDKTLLPGVSWMVPINIIMAWTHHNLKPKDLYGKF